MCANVQLQKLTECNPVVCLSHVCVRVDVSLQYMYIYTYKQTGFLYIVCQSAKGNQCMALLFSIELFYFAHFCLKFLTLSPSIFLLLPLSVSVLSLQRNTHLSPLIETNIIPFQDQLS